MPNPQRASEFHLGGVCLTSPYSLSGISGVGRFVKILAGELQRRNVPTIVAYPLPASPVPRALERPLPLTSPIAKDIELAVRTASRILRDRERFTILHSQQAHLQSVASLLVARLLGRSSLLTIHLRLAPPSSPLKRWVHSTVERLSLTLAGDVVFVSPFVAAAFHQPESVVIENGVDVDVFRPSATSRQKIRDTLGLGREFVFVFCGRWSHHKGIDLLLRAIESPLLGGRDYRVLLLGDLAPDEPGIFGHALERPEIRDRLVLVPRASDVAAYLAAGDAFLLPSRTEGMSLALLEAMAVGLPVLVSDIPVHQMLVQRYECGWMFRSESPDDLGRAMASILENGVPSEFGERARKAVIEHHSLDRMTGEYLRHYRKLLSGS